MTDKNPSLEVLMPEQSFDRRHLINKQMQLVLPPIPLQESFKLPKNAALHFVATDGIIKGPDSADWRTASVDKKIPMQNVAELATLEGAPTRVQMNIDNEMDSWFRLQRRFRKSRDVVRDDPGESGAVMYNYALLTRLYRYPRSLFTEINRWTNIWNTVVKNITNPDSARTHMLFLPVPRKLPGFKFMERMMGKTLMMQQRELPDPDARMFYELWKWINPATRHQSIFGAIPKERLGNVIIMLEDAGRIMGFRMSTIDGWLDVPENKGRTNLIAVQEVQKRLIRGVLGLMQQRADSVAGELVDGEEGESSEIRVVDKAEDAPQENIDEASFTERAQAILDKLDEDIDAHDEHATKMIDDAEVDIEQGITITERGERGVPKDFEEEGRKTIHDRLQERLDKASDTGHMTGLEYRKFNRLIATSENMPSPYDPDTLASEFAFVDPKSTEITAVDKVPPSVRIVDESIAELKFNALDRDYITNTLNRDKVACIQALQKAGIIITSHTVEREQSVMTEAEWHTIRISPIEGAPSTQRIKAVHINKDGLIFSGGTNYRYRRQRVDKPIVKISPTSVALSSYFHISKTFVTRNDRSAYSYTAWLTKQVNLKIIEGTVTNTHTGDCFNHEVKAPRAFTSMSKTWRDFEVPGAKLNFNLSSHLGFFGQDAVDFCRKNLFTPLGKGTGANAGYIFIIDDNNAVYKLHDGNFEHVNSFEGFLGIDESTKPVEFTECHLGGKTIPTGIVLGYYHGLSALVKMLGARVRQVPVGTRANIGIGEYSLVFEDYTLVFSTDDVVASLILGGFNQAAKTLRKYSMYHFDKPAVYFNVLEGLGLSGRYASIMDNMRDLFVDPITERVLIKMGEPTTYPELIKRATEMLTDDWHKRPLDPTNHRYRGAERIAGAMYNQMSKAVCEQRGRINKTIAKVEMNPYNVYKHTMSDAALSMVKDINPIHNTKEISAITYTGHGGRSARSMTRVMRGIDVNDRKTLSEASVDSAQVGFNANLSVNPDIVNTEGMVPLPTGETQAGNALSAAAAVSSCINSDDGKRIGMSTIQHSHTIACDSYSVLPVRTGMEEALAHHVDSSFASVAPQAGKIKSKNAFGITVEYADGTTESFAIGRRFGAAAGLTIPHDMTTDYSVGESFDNGSVLVYHKGFFKPSFYKKGTVNWMNGTIARVAFMDSRETYEDASSASEDFVNRIKTRVTRPRDIVVSYDREVRNLVKVGDKVNYSDALCIVEDSSVAATQVFSEDRLNILKALSSKPNTAQVSGVVDRIEVYYNGMVEDMSESLKELVEVTDKELARRCKGAGKPVVTGAVTDDEMHVDGAPLLLDHALIRIYITHDVSAANGDKGVIGWQLKTEISKVFYKRTTLEGNLPVDFFYGSKSLYARVVYSAFKIGTSITLLRIISRNMAEIYKGIRKP